jgi:hypothetical protein
VTDATENANPGTHRGTLAGGFVAGVAVTAVLALLVWLTRVPNLGVQADGARYAVATLNGQAFFGRLTKVTRDAVVLTDVYYLQSTVDPQSNQRVNRLLERSKTDIHGPTQTSIPLDKILLIETVGPDSEVARTIAQSSAARAAPTPDSAPQSTRETTPATKDSPPASP